MFDQTNLAGSQVDTDVEVDDGALFDNQNLIYDSLSPLSTTVQVTSRAQNALESMLKRREGLTSATAPSQFLGDYKTMGRRGWLESQLLSGLPRSIPPGTAFAGYRSSRGSLRHPLNFDATCSHLRHHLYRGSTSIVSTAFILRQAPHYPCLFSTHDDVALIFTSG